MVQVSGAGSGHDLSSVRLCTGGGELLGAETYRAWKEAFGLEIFEGLGTTDMMYVFSSSAATRWVKPGAIGPEEIETVVMRHPSVADCCVIGVPDAVRGQNTRAYVVLRPGTSPSPALGREIVDSCRDDLAVYKLPRDVVFVDAVPRAPGPAGPGTGKLLRRVLRERSA
jgi:acyl-coenzyme A synthetase/AMP-(fatty) acid ligase